MEWFAVVTVAADIMLGAIAWRGVRSLEANQKVQTALLQELTRRVERLEEKG